MPVGLAGVFLAFSITAPFTASIGEILAFPDRRFVLDTVDDIAVGGISFAAMRRCSDDQHRGFANRHPPRTMTGKSRFQSPFRSGFLQDGGHHFAGHAFVGFVFEISHLSSMAVITGFAAKQHYGARSRVMRSCQHSRHINRLRRKPALIIPRCWGERGGGCHWHVIETGCRQTRPARQTGI